LAQIVYNDWAKKFATVLDKRVCLSLLCYPFLVNLIIVFQGCLADW
jgi:hypothetical protein